MKQGFVIHHNGPNVGITVASPHDRCVAYWNGVRRYHMESKGWSDIAYSFGECAHGERFVGRGWDRNQFANGSDVVGVDDGKDSEWYTVLVFLGWNANPDHPIDEEPSLPMISGVRALIEEGRSSGRCGTRVLPHNAFKPKRCPGTTFTRLAAQWNNAPLTTPSRDEDDMTNEESAALSEVLQIVRVLANGATSTIAKMWTDLRTVKAQQAALASAVSQLGAGGSVDYAKVEAAAEKAVRDTLGSLDA